MKDTENFPTLNDDDDEGANDDLDEEDMSPEGEIDSTNDQ